MLSEYYLFLLGFCFITSCVCHETQNKAFIGYQYSEEVDGWLKLHRVPATWNDAHTHCLKEGAQLTSPINSKFFKAMINVMGKNYVQCEVFTGINDRMVPGYFSSIEGIPLHMISVPFEEKQQTVEESGDRIVLRPNEVLSFASQNDTYPYICYKKKHSENENGYVKDDSTGSYYKFHQDAKNWNDAALTCAGENAHLVIINSDKEASVLKKLFESHPGDTLKTVSKHYTDVIYVGMKKWPEPNGWLTINGQDLNEAGYSKWGKKQPDGSGSCGAMFRSGPLDDVPCEVPKLAFICERTPYEKFEAENLLQPCSHSGLHGSTYPN